MSRPRRRKSDPVSKLLRDVNSHIRQMRFLNGKVRQAFYLSFDEKSLVSSVLAYSILYTSPPGEFRDEMLTLLRRGSPLNAASVERSLEKRAENAEAKTA